MQATPTRPLPGAITAAALVLMVGTAHAGVVLNWDFQDAIAQIGQSGAVVLQDVRAGMSAMAQVQDPSLGSTNAELQIAQQSDASGAWTVVISSSLDMRVNEDPGAAINFSRGYTYFQLAVTVSDMPYEFDLDYDLLTPAAPFITKHDHFVSHYGSGTILQPQTEPYVLMWGAMDYTTTGFGFPGWGYLASHAETDLTLKLTPVPEPATLSLLVLGGLALIARRRAA